MGNSTYKPLDLGKILCKKHKIMTSQEALKDVTPLKIKSKKKITVTKERSDRNSEY